jgi:hypothetical protein
MTEPDRIKLLGTYRTPRFRYGDVVTCAVRGEVRIVAVSDGRIPWPKCRSGRAHAIILYGALAEAVRTESVRAVAYWFGVGRDTAWKWRVALGVGRKTEGTSALHSRWAPQSCQSAKAKRKLGKAMTAPERGAKISAALKGHAVPQSTRGAISRANKGRKQTIEERRKRSETHKKRGIVPRAVEGLLWTAEQDALLGTMTDREVGARLGKDQSAVSARRYRLKVAAFVKRHPRHRPMRWTPERDALLGTMSDVDLARWLRCTATSVFNRRRALGIPRFVTISPRL